MPPNRLAGQLLLSPEIKFQASVAIKAVPDQNIIVGFINQQILVLNFDYEQRSG